MKLNLFGNTPLILVRDPQLPLEAATKQYVDNNIASHAADVSLHLTANQNALLDNITVSATEINHLSGVTANVQTQLNSKLNLSGGTLTGSLILAGNPTSNLEAATKQYVDSGLATKLNLSGGTLTGSLILANNPSQPLEAATKQYVDNSISTHANNFDLHLTASQNALLDNITVSATEINSLADISGNVQTLLDQKFDKTGGLVTGDIVLGTGKTVFVSKTPSAGNEVVNKAYVDSLLAGQEWKDPVTDINLVDDSLSTPPASPVVGDVYIIRPSATDAWAGKEGYATYWNGTSWVFLQNRPVQAGDRFGVALTTSTAVSSSLSSYSKKVVTITSATPGSIQYTEDNITSGTTVLVFDPDSKHFGVTYTYTDEGNWVPTNTSVNIAAGDALTLDGNILNVNYGDGLTVVNNTLQANILTSSGLSINNGQIAIKLDGTTLSASANGIKVADSVMNDIADKASKTGTNTITGSIIIDSTGSLKTNATPSTSTDVVNKGYVDTADTNLQNQINTLQTTVNDLNSDPVTKSYVDAQDATKVSKAGDKMTGPLTLSGDPTQNLHAATKQYVDTNLNAHASNDSLHLTASQNDLLDNITVSATEINHLSGVTANVQTQLNSKLNLSGGVMTGALTLSADPTQNLHAATKQYVDTNLNAHASNDSLHLTASQNDLLDNITVSATEINHLSGVTANVQTQLNSKLNLSGGVMTGALTLSADPTQNLHAATKQYVDNGLATKLNLSGGTLTGSLILANNPSQPLEAATKQYVDSNITTLQTYVDTQDATKLSLTGGTLTGYLSLHADPQLPMHAVTKQYVDAVAQGLKIKPAVRLATTANLNASYNNGTFGVNATLTGNTNGALLIDGVTPEVGDRILVKNQTNKAENGDYVVQQVGNATAPFILKRVANMDESSEVPGSCFYVYDGATLKGTGWVLTVDNPVTFTIGTDNIYVNQFSGQGSLIAGNGLTITGNTIDINTANPGRIVVNPDNIDLAPTGVTPGTYTKVTVDGFGRVLSATTPNTLAGYGITDAQPLNANLTSLSNVTTNGLLVRNSNNAIATKSIVVSGVGLSISNGSGVNTGDITITSNATSNNTANTLVARDASGNFSANIITASLNGNASTATKLLNARNFSVTGDVTANSVSFNGTSDVTLNTTLTNTGVTPGTYTKVTVDAKGRITLGSNPTTVADMGLIDAATIDYVNTKIEELNKKIEELYLFVMGKL